MQTLDVISGLKMFKNTIIIKTADISKTITFLMINGLMLNFCSKNFNAKVGSL